MEFSHATFLNHNICGSDCLGNREVRGIENLNGAMRQGCRRSLGPGVTKGSRNVTLGAVDLISSQSWGRGAGEDVELFRGDVVESGNVSPKVFGEHFFGNVGDPVSQEESVVLAEVTAIEYLPRLLENEHLAPS